MKPFVFLFQVLLIAGCSNSNDNEKKQTENSAQKSDQTEASISSGQSGDIVGEWELVGFVQDTNDNLLIDEEERKNLTTASYKDYMKLNRNGTGLFTIGKMEGRYEAKPQESGGKDYLTWYDSANGRHRMGTIISVSKTELHIKEPGGNGLFLWKRI